MAAPSTRLDEDLYADATATGRLTSRSAAQQLSHWARIGRAVARTSTEGQLVDLLFRPYDDLAGDEQAVVRAEWSEAIARRARQNLAVEFVAQGRGYAELDDDGNVVVHRPAPQRRVAPESVAALFVSAYGRDAVVGSTLPLSRSCYDRWHRQQGDAPSSAAITNHFKKDWAKLPWKKLRDLAAQLPSS